MICIISIALLSILKKHAKNARLESYSKYKKKSHNKKCFLYINTCVTET